MYVCMCRFVSLCVCVFVCLYVCLFVCTFAFVYVCVCVYVCMLCHLTATELISFNIFSYLKHTEVIAKEMTRALSTRKNLECLSDTVANRLLAFLKTKGNKN